MSKHRWNNADAQAFRDGQRLRAQTINGKRSTGPEADEWADWDQEVTSMSNPTTLQELADSLAVSAEMAGARAESARPGTASMYEAGYRQALLDTRATVLAIIASGREVIRTVHEYPKPERLN